MFSPIYGVLIQLCHRSPKNSKVRLGTCYFPSNKLASDVFLALIMWFPLLFLTHLICAPKYCRYRVFFACRLPSLPTFESKLTHDETRFIYETKTIGIDNKSIKIDDIIETVNHFRCIDLAIDMANRKLSESFIKQLHAILKTGTSDANQPWFKVGDYKLLANEVGNNATTDPKDVKAETGKRIVIEKRALMNYNTTMQAVNVNLCSAGRSFEWLRQRKKLKP